MNIAGQIFFIIFGVIGFSIVFTKMIGWIIDVFQEANDKSKKIELSAIFISIIALVVAIISLYFSLQQN